MNIRSQMLCGLRLPLALLLVLALMTGLNCTALAAEKARADKGKAAAAESFLGDGFFSYQMSLADAEKLVADPQVWQVVFRIDTPSTTDLAVVYRRQYFWRASFYQGTLYALEKRGEVQPEVVEATFKSLGEQHGESREATRSEDGDLIYSRWRLENLEVSMTASREPDGLYRVTYEEADRDLLSAARRKQEQEMQAAPGNIDPITGKPRIRKAGSSGGDNPGGSESPDSQKGKAKQKNKSTGKTKAQPADPPSANAKSGSGAKAKTDKSKSKSKDKTKANSKSKSKDKAKNKTKAKDKESDTDKDSDSSGSVESTDGAEKDAAGEAGEGTEKTGVQPGDTEGDTSGDESEGTSDEETTDAG